MSALRFVALLVMAGALPAAAQPISVFGRLSGGSVGVDDVRGFDVEVRDGGDVVVAAFAVDAVPIINGAFAFDIDASVAGAVDAAAAAGPIVVDVSFSDDDDNVIVGRGVLGVVAAVGFAEEAATADRATSVAGVGTLTSADVFTAAGLADSGLGVIPIAFANITDVPRGVGDGVDNGNVDAVGPGLSLVDALLEVAPGAITSARVLDGTIGSAQIADGAVDSSIVNSATGADFAAGSLTGADFATAGFALANISGNVLHVFQSPVGCTDPLDFTVTASATSTCSKSPCGPGQFTNCTTRACETTAVTFCARTHLGVTLFAP